MSHSDFSTILSYAKSSSLEPNTKLARIISICEENVSQPLVNEKEPKYIVDNITGTRTLVNETPKVSTTGAVRSKLLGEQYRFDLLDSNGTAQRRLAAVYALGFKKYGPDNWKKGFPNSEYYAHAREHMINWINGVNSGEDDIAHAVWNLMAIMWNEENHPDMCDFPMGRKINKVVDK